MAVNINKAKGKINLFLIKQHAIKICRGVEEI
jgi:hypothetical protein